MTSAEMKSLCTEASALTQRISRETKQSFENGSLSVTINGLVLRPQNQSFKESATSLTCSKGQIVKNGICGKLRVKVKHSKLLKQQIK